MAENQPGLRQELSKVEERLVTLSREIARAQGQRETIVMALADSQGAHDQRPVGVR